MAMVLPTLSAWTEICINSIYRASTPMDNALDNLLFKDALLTVNGHRVSRNDFAKQLQAEKFDEVEAAVSFLGAVEVPTNPKSAFEAGSVGVFYTVSIQEAIRVRDAPVSSTVHASMNVVIEQDLSLPAAPPPPIRGGVDRRRVKELNLVIDDQPVPFER